MAKKRLKPPVLTDAQRQALAQGLTPIRKNEVTVVRGQEQTTIVSINQPAFGRFPLHSAGLISDCSIQRNQKTHYPEALRFDKSQVTGFILAEPVATYDETKADQYKLNWNARKTSCTMDFLPILQPLNMEVAEGFVLEVPITLEKITGTAPHLVFHLQAAELREEEEGKPRTKKAPATNPPQKPTELQTPAGPQTPAPQAESAAASEEPKN